MFVIRPADSLVRPNSVRVSLKPNPPASAQPQLKPGHAVQEASVAREIESSAELCLAALSAGLLTSVGQLSVALQDPQACFDLVLGIPYDAARMDVVRQLKQDACGHNVPFAVERFLALQACLVALPRLMQMSVPDSIKRQFCITCRDITSSLERPDERLALESAAFAELAASTEGKKRAFAPRYGVMTLASP